MQQKPYLHFNVVIFFLFIRTESVLSDQSRYYTAEGKTVHLLCGNTTSQSATWKKMTSGEIYSKKTNERITVQSDSALVIRDVKADDAGIYRCNDILNVSLLVLTVTSTPKDAKPGDKVSISCALKCHDHSCEPYTLKMITKDQERESHNTSLRVISWMGQDCICKVQVNNMIKAKTSLLLSDESRFHTSLGQSVTLPCEDSEMITWNRMGVESENVQNIVIKQKDGSITKVMEDKENRFHLLQNSSLFIERIKTSDAGTYQCNGKRLDLIVISVTFDPTDPKPGDILTVTCELKCKQGCSGYILQISSSGMNDAVMQGSVVQHTLFNTNMSVYEKTFKCKAELDGIVQDEALVQLHSKSTGHTRNSLDTIKGNKVSTYFLAAIVAVISSIF
ncbi:uncharacterized protein LOC114650561 [Erpetoichthys calabaricus]|uniref:uncharacterized protein LOC114650561 n=1 Tax=Erpetoichthys calabaricus TaxID=27687 RepID=UPI00109F5861|nr:uncharacterized protein LOC114650561 [Erpetoichthys calabaricus]